MDSFLEELIGPDPMPEFKPIVYYDKKMDYLIYINKDCSYRAHFVNSLVDYLLDPYEDKLVGWKICGFIYYFGEEKMEVIEPLIQAFLTPEIAEKYLKKFEKMYRERDIV